MSEGSFIAFLTTAFIVLSFIGSLIIDKYFGIDQAADKNIMALLTRVFVLTLILMLISWIIISLSGMPGELSRPAFRA